ncbi:hypothetical protein EC973_003454 [Apophysomyces ossiformis]|uniref:Uncharacterized protein n=1 Tax=Apophysomyces ossiformis TaxID=679940 RepID=A0A8H7BML3_9FUNG|nr:hypothetical protein EC973_003454 [Apophysomyces ossiformis]
MGGPIELYIRKNHNDNPNCHPYFDTSGYIDEILHSLFCDHIKSSNFLSSLRTLLISPSTISFDADKLGSSANLHALYSPFPVCFRSSTSSDNHALFSSRVLYYFLFPFSDDRLWRVILCQCEHLHLGFFLLGSINNIWFTYKVLNDMFDIILAGQDRPVEQDADDVEPDMARFDSMTRRLTRLLKGFLLSYCCSLVVLFWIHFNLFAFHADNSQDIAGYSSKQFVAELPLWTLRWVTLGVAVGDFAVRGVYRWLTRITNCVDEEEVLSIPDAD